MIYRNKELKVLDEKYVLKPYENWRGLSYSDLIVRWQRWLLGNNPDKNFDGNILFLRGSVGYHQSNSTYLQSSVDISEEIAILIPIITSHKNIGDYHNGVRIKNEFSLRKAVKDHVDAASSFWGTIQVINKSQNTMKIVSDLELFRVESMPFKLKVSKTNPFLDKMDEPNIAGTHTGLVAGYFVFLHDLPPSLYRIRFGGYGMDNFFTESLYEIKITAKEKTNKDLSGSLLTPSRLLKEKKQIIKTINVL